MVASWMCGGEWGLLWENYSFLPKSCLRRTPYNPTIVMLIYPQGPYMPQYWSSQVSFGDTHTACGCASKWPHSHRDFGVHALSCKARVGLSWTRAFKSPACIKLHKSCRACSFIDVVAMFWAQECRRPTSLISSEPP